MTRWKIYNYTDLPLLVNTDPTYFFLVSFCSFVFPTLVLYLSPSFLDLYRNWILLGPPCDLSYTLNPRIYSQITIWLMSLTLSRKFSMAHQDTHEKITFKTLYNEALAQFYFTFPSTNIWYITHLLNTFCSPVKPCNLWKTYDYSNFIRGRDSLSIQIYVSVSSHTVNPNYMTKAPSLWWSTAPLNLPLTQPTATIFSEGDTGMSSLYKLICLLWTMLYSALN